MIKLRRKNKKIFTALELEGDYVKLVQAVDFQGRRKIVKLVVKETVFSSKEKLCSSLRAAIAEVKAPLCGLSLVVPRHKVSVRFLHFPTVNEKEIAGMVNLQSVKELPFPKEEIVSDYCITERTRDGYAKVLLAIAHQDIISDYLEILNQVNLEPENITLSAQAIGHWFKLTARDEAAKGDVLLVDLDNENADIVIFHDAALGFTRGLNIGSRELKGQPDLKHKLIQEIRRTVEGYNRMEKARKISRIILGPAAEEIKGLSTTLSATFNLPCVVLAPFENLECGREVMTVRVPPTLSLLKVLGAAAGFTETDLNLLPAPWRQRRQRRLRKREIAVTFALLAGLIILIAGIFVRKMHNTKLRIAYLNGEIENTQDPARDIENKLKTIALIETRRQLEGSCIDILRELHDLIPGDISLSSFDYDEGKKTLSLRGISRTMPKIFEFVDALEKSTYFKNVQLKYLSEKKAEAAGFTDFKIECTLEQ